MHACNDFPLWRRLAGAACAAALLSACASAPATKADPPGAASSTGGASPAPTARQLEDCPCGNPDWARLPAGTLDPPSAPSAEGPEPDDSGPAEP